jgi:FtsZ-binding cell division protein ZapB
MEQHDPAESQDDSMESFTLRVMKDERVTGFLRFLNPIMGALTLASVLGLFGLITSWGTTLQRLTYVVEELKKDTDINTKDIDGVRTQMNNVRVDIEVLKLQQRTQGWQLNRVRQNMTER